MGWKIDNSTDDAQKSFDMKTEVKRESELVHGDRSKNARRQLFIDKTVDRCLNDLKEKIHKAQNENVEVKEEAEPAKKEDSDEWDPFVFADVYNIQSEGEVILATLGACYGALGADASDFRSNFCLHYFIFYDRRLGY